MNAFQNEFPTIFLEDESNDTDHSCSSGSGESKDLLVVNMILSTYNIPLTGIQNFAGCVHIIGTPRCSTRIIMCWT